MTTKYRVEQLMADGKVRTLGHYTANLETIRKAMEGKMKAKGTIYVFEKGIKDYVAKFEG